MTASPDPSSPDPSTLQLGSHQPGSARSLWWHIFFAATITLLAAIALQSWPHTAVARTGALTALGVMSLGYLLLRGRRHDERFGVPLVVLLVVGSGVAVSFNPSMATIQTIVFPLIWVTLSRSRDAIIATVALAVSVSIGFVVVLGNSIDTYQRTAIIEGISLVGSLALGMWFSRVAELSAERQRLLEKLTSAQDQLAALHRDTGVTSERERLAREIHDTIAQSLTGVVMLAQQAQRDLGAGDLESLARRLPVLESSTRDTLEDARYLVAAGAPLELGPGICAALDRLAERFARETGIAVTVETDPPALISHVIGREIEVVVLRLAQESLANIRKHSGAADASITLRVSAGLITFTVTDNGHGFDLDVPAHGYGLAGMRDRLALANGTLELTSSAVGTTLRALLPLTTTPTAPVGTSDVYGMGAAATSTTRVQA